MPNRVPIVPTIFKNERSNPETYGYRAYDDHGQTYCNGWDEIPDNDLDVLAQAMSEPDEVLAGMLLFVSEYQTGIYIEHLYYHWDEIEYLFEEQEEEVERC